MLLLVSLAHGKCTERRGQAVQSGRWEGFVAACCGLSEADILCGLVLVFAELVWSFRGAFAAD